MIDEIQVKLDVRLNFIATELCLLIMQNWCFHWFSNI